MSVNTYSDFPHITVSKCMIEKDEYTEYRLLKKFLRSDAEIAQHFELFKMQEAVRDTDDTQV